MPIRDMLWFIPTHGDNRFLGSNVGKRLASYDYLQQVAVAADALGYTGVLLPTGQGCEDSWVAASALIPATKRLKFLIAIRPGSLSVTLAARMAATFDRLSGGRLLLNIITGGDPVELAGDGTFLPHDERYAVTDEFLHVWQQLFTGQVVTYRGEHIAIEGGQLIHPPVQRPSPPLYFGGSSPVALDIAARHIDLYLTHAEPPQMVAEKLAAVRALAEAKRDPARPPLRFGLRAHIIVREREEDAWAAADDLLRYADDATLAKSQAKLARFDSVGQARMAALHGGNRESLVVSPNLWAGVGLINKGIGTALVGNPEQIAARLQEYADLGADTFILSAYPHLEEAYRVAELVFPLLSGWNETVRRQDEIFHRARVPAAWS